MMSRYNQPSLPIQVWGSDSKIWELPEGWGVLNLGQLVEMKTGFACAKKNLVSRGIPHLRPFNIRTNGELDFTEIYQIPDDFVQNVTDYALETGHVLFNNTNSVELLNVRLNIVNKDKIGYTCWYGKREANRTVYRAGR